MKIRNSIAIVFLLCCSFLGFGQKILLSKARVHIGNGKVINQGYVGIENDLIILVENALTYKINLAEWDTIIEVRGKELYPAFIAPNTILGLTDIHSVRGSRDYSEVGAYNPNVRSAAAFNTDSEINATVKTNGVLYAQSTPRGGVISGSSSIFKMEAWSGEEAILKADDGLHLNWPSTVVGGGWWAQPTGIKHNENYSKSVKNIYDFFKTAQTYAQSNQNEDLKMQAMRSLFKEKKILYVHANQMRALLDIIDFKEKFKLENVVIVGGYDSDKIAGQLKDANISVILRGMHDLPMSEDDPVDLPYRLPAKLQEAGVLFCISNSGSMEYINERNLPFLAGTAMSYGLKEEEAIAAISLNTAKIMGVEEMIGSIEKGKKASLFVSEGNALEIKGNKLILALIEGKFIQLENRQTELYQEYKKRYK